MDDLYRLLYRRCPSDAVAARQRHSGLEPLFGQVNDLIESVPFQQTFSALTTDSERIKLLLTNQSVCSLISKLVEQFKQNSPLQNGHKSSSQTDEFFKAGNGALQEHHYAEAVVSYSNAIRYSPQDGRQLALAYGSRSGAFFQLKQYDSALKDIDAALALDYGKHKLILLLITRKCECLLKLDRAKQAKQTLDSVSQTDLGESDAALLAKLYQRVEQHKAPEQTTEDNISTKPELLKDISSVIKYLTEKGRFQPQAKVSSLSTKVEVRYDQENGHHLVTTEDVNFGDILAVTKPYASVLTDQQERFYCHHCLAALKYPNAFPRTVPCCHCSRVLYCSEQCRDLSWKSYHHFECSLLPLSYNGCQLLCLTLRIWLTAGGLDPIQSVAHKFTNSLMNQVIYDFTENPEDYDNVYQLSIISKKTRIINVAIDDRIRNTIMICFLAKLVQSGEIDGPVAASGDSPKLSSQSGDYFSPEEMSTVEIMLRTLGQVQVNGLLFSRFTADQFVAPSFLPPSSDYFFTLEPLMSLVTCSCNPNISIITVDGSDDPKDGRHVSNVSVFFAIQPIPSGTKLTAILPRYGDWVWVRTQMHKLAAWAKQQSACTCDDCEVKRRNNPFGSSPVFSKFAYSVVCRVDGCDGQMTRSSSTNNSFHCSKCDRLATIAQMQKICTEMNEHEQDVGHKMNTVELEPESIIDDQVGSVLKMMTDKLLEDKMTPLWMPHNAFALVDFYIRLCSAYLRPGYSKEPLKFESLQKAWKCTQKCVTIMDEHFGGSDSVMLLRVLRTNVVQPFEALISGLKRSNDTEEKSRMIEAFQVVKERVQKMEQMYKLV